MRHTLSKHERLHSKKLIGQLFKEGKSISLYPIRLVYLPQQAVSSHQVLFSVSRRHYKKAVDRNRLKRQMREAYRQHKELITYTSGERVHFLLGYIYIGKEKYPYQHIETKIVESLYRLKNSQT
ncbi:MAG: ribonuclease P protein component [Cyclobacteriaceae bacterium]